RILISRFSGSGFGVSAEGSGGYRLGSGEIESLEFEWQTEATPERFSGTARIGGTAANLNIEIAASSPFEASVAGVLELGGIPRAEVSVGWTNLAWPDLEDAFSPTGTIELAGWIDSFEFSGNADVLVQGQTANIELAGDGTPSELFVDRAYVVTDYGNVTANGELRIDPLQWRFAVDAEAIDPSSWFEDWPGSLSVRGDVTGRLDPDVEWQIANASVDGVLRGFAFAATGTVGRTADSVWHLDAVELRAADGTARFDGEASDLLAIAVDIEAPEIAAFWPGASGSVNVAGSLSGRRNTPAFAGEIASQNLDFAEFSAQSLQASGSASISPDVPMALDFRVQGLRWGDGFARTLTGRVNGTAEAHSIAINADSDFGTAEVLADGGWQNDRWAGRLRAIELEQQDLGRWTLTEPAAVELGRDRLDLQRGCLELGATTACAAIRLGSAEPRIGIDFQQFDLALLSPWMPSDVSISGLYDGALELLGPWTSPRAIGRLSGDATLITVYEETNDPLLIPIRRVEADAALESGNLTMSGSVLGEDSAEIRFSSNVSGLPSASPSLDISISGLWPDVSALSLLSPDVGTVGGRAVLDLRVEGTLTDPAVQGRIQWLDGMLTVPRWGFIVDNVMATASSDDGENAVVEGTATAGEGTLYVSGLVELDPDRGWPGSLRITGEELQAVRLPDSEVFVTPNLNVLLALPDIQVDGTLDIPRARMQLDRAPEQATLPSPDTIVHGTAEVAPTRPLRVTGDLVVSLGDDVTYAGDGLDAGLGGSLDLHYESGQSAIATGNIDIEGQYQTFGQTLILERSRLFFAGPLDNPDLDVRAVRRTDSVTAGVQLTGPLRSPTSRVFSEPAMAEADALSYLIFGRPLSATEAAENATLESAAVTLGLQQALPVVRRIGETLGFDEFNLQTTAADAGELMAGKQLSPRLYVRYTYGLFNRLGGLLMRLELNDRFSLETRSGQYKSMDLIYSTERN
ncbi:MAG TPA: translocation/assembly module TamB domain-containing protein, partial [Gammaproteobacteria bacterium]